MRLGRNYWKLWVANTTSNLGDGVALVAYPWLASAVTRDPMLIALIAVAQRLPWLLFTLPAGVITDRGDRRKILYTMDIFRTVLTLAVAMVVLVNETGLASPESIAGGLEVATNYSFYLVLLMASLLFGFAEVLHDNAAQTIVPALVEPDQLERANGNLWGAEMAANAFVGPPVGSLLIGVAFFLPFFFDAGTFAVAAAVVFVIGGDYRVQRDGAELERRVAWWAEIKQGVRWLWGHSLLRTLAVVLGVMNGLFMVAMATFVLYAQEVLHANAFIFAVLGMAGAVGGVLGGFLAPRITPRLGSGASLRFTLAGEIVTPLVIGVTSLWPVAWVAFAVSTFLATLWNVVTVSLRQTIIPDALLGRVNSVYRFFGWGMMPIGLALGGLIVVVVEGLTGNRELALRMPFFVTAAAYIAVLVYAAPRLTTSKIETARAAGIKAEQRSS